MASLGQVFAACLDILQIEFQIDGLVFSLWEVFLWLIVAGAVVFLILKWSDS